MKKLSIIYPNFSLGGVTTALNPTIDSIDKDNFEYEVITKDQTVTGDYALVNFTNVNYIKSLVDNQNIKKIFVIGHRSFCRSQCEIDAFHEGKLLYDLYKKYNNKIVFVNLTDYDYEFTSRFIGINHIHGYSYPFDLKSTKVEKIPHNNVNIGMASRICREKNNHHLLSILDEIDPSINIYIGDAYDEDYGEKSYYDKFIEGVSKYDNVILVDKNKLLSDMYPYIDLLISFSGYESAPLSYIEAMNNNIPIACYDAPVFDHNKFPTNIKLFPMRYYHDMAKYINTKDYKFNESEFISYMELPDYMAVIQDYIINEEQI